MQLNDDISMITQTILYLIIAATTIVSFMLYKKIKKDIHLQEVNSITLEIHQLHKKIQNTSDEETISSLEKKIQALEREKEELLNQN
jgi:septal ring factor EnvC (AmiA/AmiB activator)